MFVIGFLLSPIFPAFIRAPLQLIDWRLELKAFWLDRPTDKLTGALYNEKSVCDNFNCVERLRVTPGVEIYSLVGTFFECSDSTIFFTISLYTQVHV